LRFNPGTAGAFTFFSTLFARMISPV